MIVAAGLTPAWQHIVQLDRLAAGEVNRAREVHSCASGKVLNVGIALTFLGAESRTIAPVGGTAREAILRELDELGVTCGWLISRTPTRICTTILDSASHFTTELVENAPPMPAVELDVFQRVFKVESRLASHVVLTGSLPAGTPENFYRELMQRTKAEAILDARGAELLIALEHRPLVVKPNREELARTVRRTLDTDAAVRAAMFELTERGARWVIVTSGTAPAWILHEGRFWRAFPPAVEIVNPIGCGDCLAAGIAVGLDAGKEPIEAIRLGFACAGENATMILPSRLERGRVAALCQRVRVEPWKPDAM